MTNLKQLVTRESSLPELATAPRRLQVVLQQADVDPTQVINLIQGSPALTSGVLRAAGSAYYRQQKPITDISRAVTVLGNRALYSVAVSVMMQSIVSHGVKQDLINTKQYVMHSSFVGAMARYLFESHRDTMKISSELLPEEVFAIGILHEVGLGIFAIVDPTEFRQVLKLSQKNGVTLSDAYELSYGEPACWLSAVVLESWGLPSEFVNAVYHMDIPASHATEAMICSCLHYSEYLAETFGYGLTRNLLRTSCDPFAEKLVGIDERKQVEFVKKIGDLAWSFCNGAKAA